MTVIRNRRDQILQAATVRGFDPAYAQIVLTPSHTIFEVSADGITPAEITFKADLYGLTGLVTFEITGGSMTRVGNVATLKAADATGNLIQVTAKLVSNGKTYSDTKSINKIAPTSPGEISDSLLGQVGEDFLTAALRGRIALVDAGVEMVGSVTARVKAETDARVAALDAAIAAATAARDAFVKGYTYSKVETDQAEALQTFNVTTAYTTYVDGQSGITLNSAKAYVQGYSYSKTTSDDALAAMASTLRSEIVSASGGTVSQAWVENYAYSKTQIDSSEASQFNTLTANYRAYANSARDDAIIASSANVANYSYSKAQSDSALASMASTLRSEFTSIEGGVSAAYVQNYTYSKAESNQAISSATSTLVSTVGDHTTAIQTQVETTNGLKGQMTVKIDNNGYVTGYGLASSYVNGVPTSAFIVNAGRFAVVSPGLNPVYMFTVGLVNGQTKTILAGDMLADGGITARNLVISNYGDNLVPDPHMKDPQWWGRPGAGYANFEGLDSPWRSFRVMQFTIANSGGWAVWSDTFTPMFPIERGAWYKVEFQVYMSPDFDGAVSAVWHLPAKAWHLMGGPTRGYNFSDAEGGIPVMFDGGSPNKGQVLNFSDTVYMEDANPYLTRSQFRHIVKIYGGYIEFGGYRITRVADETLIGPGVVQTKHLIIDKGGSIYNGQQTYGQGNGFHIQGAGPGHGARMSLGNSNGRQLLCDPDNNVLGLYGVDLINPNLQTAFSISLPPILVTGQNNGSLTTGLGVASSGGTAERFQWTLTTENSGGSGLELRGDPTSSNPTLYAFGSTVWVYGWISVTAWSTTGASDIASAYVRIQFGNAQEM